MIKCYLGNLIDFFNKNKIFTEDYSVLYIIPKFSDLDGTTNQDLFKFNAYFKNLGPNQTVVFMGIYGYRDGTAILSGNVLVINKEGNTYIFKEYKPDLYNPINEYTAYTLNFMYQNKKSKSKIVLRAVVDNSKIENEVYGYYIFGINTSHYGSDFINQITSIGVSDKSKIYDTPKELLKSIFDSFHIDHNYKIFSLESAKLPVILKDKILYLNEFLDEYPKGTPIVLMKQNYLEDSYIDESDIDETIGVIIIPTKKKNRKKLRICNISYIRLVVYKGKYKFLIDGVDSLWTVNFLKSDPKYIRLIFNNTASNKIVTSHGYKLFFDTQ